MTKRELAELQDLRDLLTMERFGASGRVVHSDGFGRTSECSATTFIREETRAWRESWVFPVLDRIIAKYELRHGV